MRMKCLGVPKGVQDTWSQVLPVSSGKQKDGDKWQTRLNGSETLIVCIYVQTPDCKQTNTTAGQAVDQDLPF